MYIYIYPRGVSPAEWEAGAAEWALALPPADADATPYAVLDRLLSSDEIAALVRLGESIAESHAGAAAELRAGIDLFGEDAEAGPEHSSPNPSPNPHP